MALSIENTQEKMNDETGQVSGDFLNHLHRLNFILSYLMSCEAAHKTPSLCLFSEDETVNSNSALTPSHFIF